MSNLDDKRQIIIGYANTIHDPAICVLEGSQVYAESLERHMQCKRAWDGDLYYSARPLTTALAELGVWPLRDADVKILSTWNTADLAQWSDPSQMQFAPARAQAERISTEWRFVQLLQSILTSSTAGLGRSGPPRYDLRFTSDRCDHHLTHAANCVFTAPFDECVVMILDGFAEQGSSAFYHFKNNQFLRLGGAVGSGLDMMRGSFGTAYSVITSLCGFVPLEGEEWKVMGLAAYGCHRTEIYEFFKDHTHIDGLDVSFSWLSGAALAELERIVQGFRAPTDHDVMRSADLAHNFQKAWEETVIKIAQALDGLGFSKNLVYGGGCALNSSANGKILANTSFERLHVPSAPADDGNALGVVLYEKHCIRQEPREGEFFSPYLGTSTDIKSLEKILSFGGIKYKKASDNADLCDSVSDILIDGDIIGWMQGRAEFGPRALGNRSILADPRPTTMKTRINARIKFREDYRPIAPSVLADHGARYFEAFQESPYMERTLKVKEDMRGIIPAVVHVDGTARLQTVTQQSNTLFYDLIQSFNKKTGVPMLVNTSLNVMGKPIVHSVEDAIAVFFTSGLDHLVVGLYILSK